MPKIHIHADKRLNRVFRAKAGIMTIVLSALSMNLVLLLSAITTSIDSRIGSDEYSLYESRFLQIKDILNTNKPVGYISTDYCTTGSGIKDFNYGFNLAQYALAPLVLVDGSDFEHIICNNAGSGKVDLLCRYHNMKLIKDYGNGVMLLKRYK